MFLILLLPVNTFCSLSLRNIHQILPVTCLFTAISALPRFLLFASISVPYIRSPKTKSSSSCPHPLTLSNSLPIVQWIKARLFSCSWSPYSPPHSLAFPSSFCFSLAIGPPVTLKTFAFLHIPCLSKLCSFPLQGCFFLCLSGDFSLSCLSVLSGFS